MPTETLVDPRIALGVFALVAVVLAVLFWPRRGILARTLSLVRLTDRVRIEDALKHLLNEETTGRRGTLESLAGALEISQARAVGLIARLEGLALARSDGPGLALTEEGRAYAMRVLRTHRLWERYLADRTGVPPVEWHAQAEVQEHALSAEEAEDLASRMGHPLYDPHGDPIPTATGELPAPRGMALTKLRAGQAAAIVHLEDEPRQVYDRLVAEGLSPQMQIQVTETAPGRIRFRSEGQEHVLEPVLANNVTVLPLPEADEVEHAHETLAALAPGEVGRVVHIAPGCQGPQRRRLLDLGVVPGTPIAAELISASGDPVAYRIRGALIALRREQAEWIHIERAAAQGREA